jgi:hypothetical protein
MTGIRVEGAMVRVLAKECVEVLVEYSGLVDGYQYAGIGCRTARIVALVLWTSLQDVGLCAHRGLSPHAHHGRIDRTGADEQGAAEQETPSTSQADFNMNITSTSAATPAFGARGGGGGGGFG